jgi:hypothetical protein
MKSFSLMTPSQEKVREVLGRAWEYLSDSRPPYSTAGKNLVVKGSDLEVLIIAAVNAPEIHERIEIALGFQFHPANLAAAIEAKIADLQRRIAELEPPSDFQI